MSQPPKYRLHKPSRLAVVTLAGKDHYLGLFDSPESWQRYHRLLLEHLTRPAPCSSTHLENTAAPLVSAEALTVNELILRYWQFAKQYYVKQGQPTSELDNLRQALRFLRYARWRDAFHFVAFCSPSGQIITICHFASGSGWVPRGERSEQTYQTNDLDLRVEANKLAFHR